MVVGVVVRYPNTREASERGCRPARTKERAQLPKGTLPASSSTPPRSYACR